MPSEPLKLTVLGSGTSMGVPTPGCHCRVCSSSDSNDNRLRPSLLLSRHGQFAVIDTTPDFRQQALRAGLDRLDAVLLTHAHADHIMGFDDVRPYSLRQNMALPVYANGIAFETLRRAFSYVFDDVPKLSSIPSVSLHEVRGAFELLGTIFTPIPLLHGNLEVLGYRFGRAAYLTDFSSLPDSSLPLLQDLDELILDALRDIPHPMHQTVEQALALVNKIQPRRAWFTHIAHDLSHAETNERLRVLGYPHVQLAYDGLELEVSVAESDVPRKGVESSLLGAAPFGSKGGDLDSANFDSARALSARTERSERVGVKGAGAESSRSGAPPLGFKGGDFDSAGAAPARTERREAVDSNDSGFNQVISVFSSSSAWAEHYAASGRGSALAIGNFDGVHLGHQAILGAVTAHAKQLHAVSTVLTFDPLPSKILRPDSAPPRLSTNAQRIDRLAMAGVESAVVLPFTHELSRLTPEEFVEQILVRDLHVRAVFIGENFRFGHRQSGDAQLLRQMGVARGFEVVILPHLQIHGRAVSSTIIRRAVAEGDVAHAGRLLGRPFALTGAVVSGTGTGRRVTVPTLNLSPEQELLPARGVYVTRTRFPGETRTYRSVTNIGNRPTFNGAAITVETHILEPFDLFPGNANLPVGEVSAGAAENHAVPRIADTRSASIEIQFWMRLRDEKKFASPEELREQIARDVARAQKFFNRLRLFRSPPRPAGEEVRK